MPELAEVEYGRRLAERVCRGRKILKVELSPDPIVFAEDTPRTFIKNLRGATVRAAHRWGKFLWLELEGRPSLVIHFGMTGSLRSPTTEVIPLATGPRVAPEWPPRFWKLRLRLSGDEELVFVNSRRLGRVWLRADPRNEAPIARLGFDPFLDPPSAADFCASLAKRRVAIKTLLLNQRFAAGVGNWLADEILYQARIDPRRRACDLSEKEGRAVHRQMIRIVRRAVAVDADKSKLPRTWLFHVRWGKDPNARTAKGERVEHVEIGGRTTAWVPSRQG